MRLPLVAPACVAAWKKSLENDGKSRVARVLGAPPGTEGYDADDDLFPEWDEWLKLEESGPVDLIDVDADEEDEEPEAEDAEEDGEAEDAEEEA